MRTTNALLLAAIVAASAAFCVQAAITYPAVTGAASCTAEAANSSKVNPAWETSQSPENSLKFMTKLSADGLKLSAADQATCSPLLSDVQIACDEQTTLQDGCCNKDCADAVTAMIAKKTCYNVMVGALNSGDGAGFKAGVARMLFRCTGNNLPNSALTAAPKLILAALAVFMALMWF